MAIPNRNSPLLQGPQPWRVGKTQEKLLQQQARIQKRIDEGRVVNPNVAQNRLNKVNTALSQLPQQQNPVSTPAAVDPNNPTPSMPWDDGLNSLFNSSNDAIQGLLSELKNSGPFNPGDYSAQRQRAEDAVMKSFERSSQARWQREEENFRARMNQQGIPEGSDAYRQRYQIEIGEPKQQAYEQAQNQAVQVGQQEQAQAYNQQYQTFQAPQDRLAALNPFINAETSLAGTALQGLTQQQIQDSENKARMELERLVQSGQITRQQAELRWKQRQNRLDRVLSRRDQDLRAQLTREGYANVLAGIDRQSEADINKEVITGGNVSEDEINDAIPQPDPVKAGIAGGVSGSTSTAMRMRRQQQQRRQPMNRQSALNQAPRGNGGSFGGGLR